VPTFKQFRLPDAGEGLTEAEILKWYVKPGDMVTVNQTIVEIETAKAAVELPCPFAGAVTELLVPEGATVDVGTPILTVDVKPEGVPGVPHTAQSHPEDLVPPPPEEAAVEPGLIGSPAPGGRTAVLVGYGPRSVVAKRRPRRNGPAARTAQAATGQAATAPAETGPGASAPAAETGPGAGGPAADLDVAGPDAAGRGERGPVAAGPGEPGPAAAGPAERGPVAAGTGEPGPVAVAPAKPAAAEPAGAPGPASNGHGVSVLAKPPVRKLARDLGVDLGTLTGSGDGGVITRADVEAAARTAAEPEPAGTPVAPAAPVTPAAATWDASREQRIPIKGVRKHTAAAMVASAFTAPHVTEWLTVDMTETMRLRDRVAASAEFAGVKVSPLVFAARALLLAVRRHPMVNSAWDEQAQEIVVKQYVNLGIAAATPRGLVVPNIKDAGRLTTRELAEAIKELTDTARAGKTTPADMAGGTITITNVGVFGVDGGTPILNPGEAAILALGAVRDSPWVVDGQLTVRQVCQLSLSFDHRIVDGQLGSEFLADIAAVLTDPGLALALG
jgi:2-oxoisovalerate dehydrogenase E2 component (dihydrolipoyl transacylase)